MNKLVLASAVLLLVSAATDAEAAILKGAAADAFIGNTFPMPSSRGRSKAHLSISASGEGIARVMPGVTFPPWAPARKAQFPVAR